MRSRLLKIAAVVFAVYIFAVFAAYATLWCVTDGGRVHTALPLSWFVSISFVLWVSAYVLFFILLLLLLVALATLARRLFVAAS